MTRHDVPKAKPIASCRKCGRCIEYEHPYLSGHINKDGLAQDGVCGVCLGRRTEKLSDADESFKKLAQELAKKASSDRFEAAKEKAKQEKESKATEK